MPDAVAPTRCFVDITVEQSLLCTETICTDFSLHDHAAAERKHLARLGILGDLTQHTALPQRGVTYTMTLRTDEATWNTMMHTLWPLLHLRTTVTWSIVIRRTQQQLTFPGTLMALQGGPTAYGPEITLSVYAATEHS